MDERNQKNAIGYTAIGETRAEPFVATEDICLFQIADIPFISLESIDQVMKSIISYELPLRIEPLTPLRSTKVEMTNDRIPVNIESKIECLAEKIENKKIIGLKDMNIDLYNLPIIGIILVSDNANVIKESGNENGLLTNNQVYQFIKNKKPKNDNTANCFMNRLRDSGLPGIKIGGSYKYKQKDLDEFLEKETKY